jgi:hypothetical protein
MDKERCIKEVHNGGRSVFFHRCLNRRVVGEFCLVHSPTGQMARRAARPQCAHVDEESGERDCSTIVNGTKYCKWHAESVVRHRVYARAQAQANVLEWLRGIKPGKLISPQAVIERLKVELKNV